MRQYSLNFERLSKIRKALVLLCGTLIGISSSTAGMQPSFVARHSIPALQAADYDIYSGDVNGDGRPDWLFRAKSRLGFVEDDFTIPIWMQRGSTYLALSQPDGSYGLIQNPSADLVSHHAWRPGAYELEAKDVDGDGANDLQVRAVKHDHANVLIRSRALNGHAATKEPRTAMAGGALIGQATKAAALAQPATVAGATPGRFDVTAAGAAAYDIPIWVPRGPNGVQPTLSINYNSRRGRSTMGPGWAISGLGAIHRCNKTFAQDTRPAPITLSTSDGYCLDGNRLRLVSGTYGSAGSTYQTELADFSQVTAYGSAGSGPAYFFVQRKDGLIYEYGNSTDSRIIPSGKSTPYQWRLNKVRDRNGNQYVVTYGVGQSGSVGVGVPLSASYTATAAGATTYRYKIVFEYVADNDDGTEIRYVAGGSTINKNLLSSVSVQRVDSGTTTVRKYSFGYETSPTTNRSRLVSVQECADAALTKCLSPTVIAYQDGASGVADIASPAVDDAFVVRGAYDFNGDGRQDILYTNGSGYTSDFDQLYVALATTAGYGSPIATGLLSKNADVGDLVASGRDDILVRKNDGFWYRYFWNGSAFSSEKLTLSIQSDESIAGQAYAHLLADLNGDGRPDLLTTGSVRSGNTCTVTLYARLNSSTNGSVTFASTRTSVFSYTSGIASDATCEGYVSQTHSGASSRRRVLDFNGDGLQDILFLSSAAWVALPLVSNGTNYVQFTTANLSVTEFADWNDDSCSDLVSVNTILISACNGFSGQTLSFNERLLGVMDWNADGRADLLVESNGKIGVRLSTGRGLGALQLQSVPVPNCSPCLYIIDQNGDGLDDLLTRSIGYPTSPLSYGLHKGTGNSPDLAVSVADGFGVAFQPTYRSIVDGSYTKSSGAVLPERDVLVPLYVVNKVTASDGAGGSFSRTFAYSGARENIQGRGFSGFQSLTVTDSRSAAPVVKTYYKTAFPYTVQQYQRDVYQSNGTTLIERTVHTLATKTLSSTANQQRYFPYVSNTTQDTYEVGGAKNGALIAQLSASSTYDNYGNITSSTTTLTDKDSAAPQSPTYNQSWTTTAASTVSPNTTNWCVGIPTQTSITRSATGVPAITRTTSFTPDYVKCRVTQAVVEPSSTTYKVTFGYGYDSFGNVNSQTVTGVGMAARTTSANWGTTGQFPVTVTNALSQATSVGYDYNLGVQTSIKDPNNITAAWAYDEFGRIKTETRPDGTSTSYTYNNCTTVTGGCQNGDPASASTAINKLVVIATAKDTGGNALRDDWTYLDQLGRTIVTKSRTLSGYSRVGAQYDAFGRLYRQTVPCDSASCSTYWITNSYDPLHRLTQQSRRVSVPDTSTQITTISYQGMTAVVTDPLSKTTTKAADPNGWLRQSKDHDGYYQSFAYDAFGALKAVTDSKSNSLFSATYDYGLDAFRRQTVDMDLGTWSYTPNALGEVSSYKDANGSTFSLTYDKLSRPLTQAVSGEGTITWTWGSSAASYNIGKLQRIASASGPSETYSYDNKGRLMQQQIVSDATYSYNLSYSSTTGFLDTLTYPTSTSSYRLKVQYGYQNGLLKQISDYNASATVFWRADAMNPRGQITQETLGNGIVAKSGFDAVTGWLGSIQAGSGGGAGAQNEAYLYDKVGNVTQRQNISISKTETFYYDNLYRLDYSKLGSSTNLDLSYDALGNITKRCEPTCGATWTYHSTKKHAVTQASVGSTTYSYGYDNNGNVTSRNGSAITWNKYNYPTLINGAGESVNLYYDANLRRWKQVYTQGTTTETTIYVGGLLEKVTTGSATDWRHYIRANGKTVAVVSRTSTGTNTTRYILEDHQGSVAKVTSSTGSTVIGESFAAFGARRDATTWTGAPSSSDLTTINGISRQGYTGHTALGNLGLNHMNGRVQDALTGRFLSPDPFVTEPGNTQGFNRFSYVNNNPLSFADPSGFEGVTILKLLGNPLKTYGTSHTKTYFCR